MEEFLDWKRSYTKWAFERYRVWVTRFQRFVDCPPESIRSQDYVRFADEIKCRHAPKNVQYALNIIHNYLRFFSEQGRLGFPMFFIRVPKARAESHYCISDAEYQCLLATASGVPGHIGRRNEALIRMLRDTGMRLGEMLSMKLSDLGTERTAQIHTEKTVEDRHVFWTRETDGSLQQMVNEWKCRFSGHKDAIASSAPLFQNSTAPGTQLSARSVERILKDLCSKAGLTQRICPHSFRHAFIHRMARKGTPDSVTALLVGHTTPMTVAHYTKLSRTEQRHFVEDESTKMTGVRGSD